MSNKVVVIAVHPDDETLGCGGTILKHLSEGDEVHCILITKGNKEQEITWEKVKAAYSFSSSRELNFPELNLADISLNELIPAIEKEIREIKPSVLYIPNRSDIHSDHRAVYEACLAFTKSFRFPFIEEILMCEVLSETNYAPTFSSDYFIPNVYVDITKFYSRKMEIMNLYGSELMQAPDPRSLEIIESYMKVRGSYIGVDYAEAFQLYKMKR